MRFFVDNNLSTKLAKGMKEFGEDVVHLTDHFDEDEDDPIWLKYIGSNGWILITRDLAVRRRPAELQALREHNVGAFFLGGKNRSRCELVQQVVRNWPRMKELARRSRKPFAFRVPPKGTAFDPIPLL